MSEIVDRVVEAIEVARAAWMSEKYPDGKYWDENFAEVPDEVIARAAIGEISRIVSILIDAALKE